MAPWPYPFWIAHRGGGNLAPENTMAAFRVGVAHGYRMAECDVKLSADGEPFLLHDTTLDRTTDARGVAASRPWAQLRRVDAGRWFGAHHAGERLPLLADLLPWAAAADLLLNLEIKPSLGQAEATGDRVARDAAAHWAGGPGPAPLISSFDPEALRAAAAAAPALPRALLVERYEPGAITQALALGCVALVADHPGVDGAAVEAMHAAGLRALAYTVDDAARAAQLKQAGIDGLITDALDRFDPRRPLA